MKILFFLPSTSPTSIHSVTEFIKPVCNSQTPFRRAKVLFIIRDAEMAAFSLYSSSNLTLRQIRLCISEKKRCNFLSCLSFYSFDNLANTYDTQDIICFPAILCECTNLDYCTHLWHIIHIIMFPYILSTNLFDVLFIYLTCLWEIST